MSRTLFASFVAIVACVCTEASATAATPSWWSYDRPATSSSVYRQVSAPMRDGVRLGCDLHLPARGGRPIAEPTPSIIYEVTPYAAATPLYLEQGDYFAKHGYSAITCNVRGTGRSGGSFPQINQPAEQTDAYDLVEWVAAQDWSNGRVGQTGESYGGMMTYRAAASRAPHLVAVVPQQAPNDLYLDDIYPGGVQATPVTQQWWPLIGAVASLGRINPARLFATQARHPTRDAFWEQIAIDSVLDRIDVPVLAVAGWRDPLFRDGSTRNFERLVKRRGTGSTYLISGPWTHGGVFAWTSCRTIGAACAGGDLIPRGALLAWFDHWVAQRPDAPLPSATVTSYQGPKGLGAGWRERDTVFPEASPTTLTLTDDGKLTLGRVPDGDRSWTTRPGDGLRRSVPRLRFTSDALPADTALVGRPTLTAWVSSSKTDANLLAELRWIRPDGSAKTISEGWLKASHRRSHGKPTPLTPGQPTELTIALQPLDFKLPAGSRLMLQLSSGSSQRAVPLSQRRITIATGRSTLRLQFEAADR